MFVKVAAVSDIMPGGMMAVKANEQTVILCNVAGTFHAVSRQCGHDGAALDKGTLNGRFITCPLHFAQFDVTDGKALLGPCPRDYGLKEAPDRGRTLETHDLRTYQVRVEGGSVLIDI
ncbi:MAG: Sulredoxin [Methanomassiliicoccales archaeon PtaU1.Bin124]|nr:MAG: Sulredoxin [Methanomassiliicoccales archaeon PtaU1.Bin124]